MGTQKEARKVAITAILHTDNALHFEMVRDLSRIYEITSDACEQQASEQFLTGKYLQEVLQKHTTTWLALFLHLADVSNSSKPFDVCRSWAWRVLDEFFAQGDDEKEMGIPVGMLNDRDKVNKPSSQHGFINFLVAPLLQSTCRLFPPLKDLYVQMASNLEEWRNIWVAEVQPSAEDISGKDKDIVAIKLIVDELVSRCCYENQ